MATQEAAPTTPHGQTGSDGPESFGIPSVRRQLPDVLAAVSWLLVSSLLFYWVLASWGLIVAVLLWAPTVVLCVAVGRYGFAHPPNWTLLVFGDEDLWAEEARRPTVISDKSRQNERVWTTYGSRRLRDDGRVAA